MAKGQGWERKLSKLLSSWITGGKRRDVLWRTVGSGGFSHKHSSLSHQIGDIGLLDSTCEEAVWFVNKIAVEAKFLKHLEFWPFSSGFNVIKRFWKKISKEAKGAKTVCLLIIKINNFVPLVFMSYKLYCRLSLFKSMDYYHMYSAEDKLSIVCVKLEDFEKYPFKEFRKAVDNYLCPLK